MPDKNEPWWKPAVEIFGQVSVWVVVPIVLALIIGKRLDGYYSTKPWIFLGLSCFGFLISSFGIVLTVTKYMRKLAKEIKIKPSTDSVDSVQENGNTNNKSE